MKRFILLTLVLLIASSTTAQTSSNKLTLGVGLNFPSSFENVGLALSGTLGEQHGLYAHVRNHTYNEHTIAGVGMYFGIDKFSAIYIAPTVDHRSKDGGEIGLSVGFIFNRTIEVGIVSLDGHPCTNISYHF